MNKFNIEDRVVINGIDGAHIVKVIFEQLLVTNSRFELWSIVKSELDGFYREVSCKYLKLVSSLQEEIDELLDEYNDYMELEQLFNDGGYKELADQVLEKIKGRRAAE